MNNRNFKEPSTATNVQPGGHDPIIGQNNHRTLATGLRERIRDFTLTYVDTHGAPKVQRVSTDILDMRERDWVIPTGGSTSSCPPSRR